MGYRAAMGKRDAFAQPQEHYSEEAGQFPIAKKGRDNFYWKRGMKRGEVYQEGRVARQPEMGSQEVVVGLGLRDMLKLDHVIFAFNNATKDDAFALAMEGSVGGRIEEDGSDIGFIERKKGEGEKIWDELSEFALELEKAKVLRPGTVEMINKRFAERRNPKKCGLLYRAIYKAFDKQQIPGGSRFYEIMGDYSKKYIGRRSPLGQFIRMRERLGRDNIIVATPEVVKGTTYEALAA
jgi:hypothetical protein